MGASRPRLIAFALALALALFAAVPLVLQPHQAWAATPGKAAIANVTSSKPGQVTVTAKKAKGAVFVNSFMNISLCSF